MQVQQNERKARIKIIREHYDLIENLIAKVDTCVNKMVEKHKGEINFLCTIPGIDRSSAITIISEIGTNMGQFSSSKRLCCWAGLTSGNNESAGKKKSVRISRAGFYLKPALVQVAHAAVKNKSNPYYALKYERIAKRRGKKRAIIAIARMILTAIYSMFCTGEVWNTVDLFKIDMPEHLKEHQLAKTIKQATHSRDYLLLSVGGICLSLANQAVCRAIFVCPYGIWAGPVLTFTLYPPIKV